MKRIVKKFSLVGLMIALVTVLLIPTTVQAAVTPKLNKKSVTLCVGKSTALKVTNTRQKAKWSSKNKKIATVNAKGKIVAKKKGTTYITAKVGKKSVKCKVVVRTHKYQNVPEKGHYEKKIVGYDESSVYECYDCGAKFYDWASADDHTFNCFHTCNLYTSKTPIYKNVWVVDSKAYKVCTYCKTKK